MRIPHRQARDGEEKSALKQKYTITLGDVEMNVICEESPETVEKIVGHVDRKIREINLGSSRCSKHEAALLCALDYCTEKLNLQAKLNEVETQNDKLFRALERLQRENEKLGESLDFERSRTTQLTASLEAAHAEVAQEKLRAQAAAAAAVAAAGAAHPAISTQTVPMAVVSPIMPKEEPAQSPVSAEAELTPAPIAAEEQPTAQAPEQTPEQAAEQTPEQTPEQAAEEQSVPSEEAAPAEQTAPAEVPAPEEAPAPAAPKPSVGTATPLDHIVQKKKTYSYRSSAAARAKNKVGNMFDTLTFHDDE